MTGNVYNRVMRAAFREFCLNFLSRGWTSCSRHQCNLSWCSVWFPVIFLTCNTEKESFQMQKQQIFKPWFFSEAHWSTKSWSFFCHLVSLGVPAHTSATVVTTACLANNFVLKYFIDFSWPFRFRKRTNFTSAISNMRGLLWLQHLLPSARSHGNDITVEINFM